MTDIAKTAATQTQVLALELNITDSAQKEIIQKHLVAMLAMERERCVPDGWTLVPIEPTPEMIRAGESWSGLPSQTWRDMIDAAPEGGEQP